MFRVCDGLDGRDERKPTVSLAKDSLHRLLTRSGPFKGLQYEGAWVAVTPHGVLPRDSHEISPPIGGGTQVDDFTKGFIEGKKAKHIRRRNVGGQGDPDPLMSSAPHPAILMDR